MGPRLVQYLGPGKNRTMRNSAPQNDCLNISFVAENWLEMVEKQLFWRAGRGSYQ